MYKHSLFLLMASFFVLILMPAVSQDMSSGGEGGSTPLRDIALDVNLDIAGMTISGDYFCHRGYSWADNDAIRNLPLIPIPVPSINAELHSTPPQRKEEIEMGWHLGAFLSVIGLGSDGGIIIVLPPVVSLDFGVSVYSGWNFGGGTMMGVYDINEEEYERTYSLDAAVWTFAGSARADIPLPYHNSLRISGGLTYLRFTDAHNKEYWKCGMYQECVNGWRLSSEATFTHLLNGMGYLKSVSISGGAMGWIRKDDFDDDYDAFNPTYITFTITPSILFVRNARQTLTVAASIARERTFVDDEYDSDERLLQKYDGSKWRLKGIMAFARIKLH